MTSQLRAKVALAEIHELGLTIEDLLAVAEEAGPRAAGPTFAEYLPTVEFGYPARSRRTYGSYWRLAVAMIGELPLARITSDDLLTVVDAAAARARRLRPGSDGRASRENCVGALRAVFRRAHRAGLVSSNPALLVDKPRRKTSRRRALNQRELDELWSAVAGTTRDPELDLLLLRFHLESGARRQGAISLRTRDLDLDRQTVWLHEKFGKDREQPISRTLLVAISEFATSRGSTDLDDHVFMTNYHRAGRRCALSDRVYDRIFRKAQAAIPWAVRTPLTAHVLRYTGIKAVERLAGKAVAAAFAGHEPEDVTGGYAVADITEVAAAVAMLTDEPHPLDPSQDVVQPERLTARPDHNLCRSSPIATPEIRPARIRFRDSPRWKPQLPCYGTVLRSSIVEPVTPGWTRDPRSGRMFTLRPHAPNAETHWPVAAGARGPGVSAFDGPGWSSTGVVRHELQRSQRHQVGRSVGLVDHEAVRPSELPNPVEAGPARGEPLPLGDDRDGEQTLLTGCDHGADHVGLRVDVVTSELMLDVASLPRSASGTERRRSDGGAA